VARRLVYVDLEKTLLEETRELVIYRDAGVARAHSILAETPPCILPIPGMAHFRAGTKIIFDNKEHKIAFVNGKRFNMVASHLLYVIECNDQHVRPMSYPTYTKRLHKYESVKERDGHRIAYQQAHIPLILDYRSPVNGVRPHEVCYIDHTISSLATISPRGISLGKPTFTLAQDGHTTQMRGMYLGYTPASTFAVLMVLRDYIRRWGRLPKILVVDGGKEFRSGPVGLFCLFYGIDLRLRPPAKPRTGSRIERAIGATEYELIAQLTGNTHPTKHARMMTKETNPFPRAEWTLPALYGAFEEYFNIRDNRIHPAFGVKPRQYEEAKR
jgi:putative transposase